MATANITIPVTFTLEVPDDVVSYVDSVDVLDELDERLHTALAREMVGEMVSAYVTITGQEEWLDFTSVVLAVSTPSPSDSSTQY